MTHPLSQADFDSIYARVPRLCVELVMVEPGGVVLTKRSIPPGEGMWHLPGGTVRFGETLAEAARRVALDETGVSIELQHQLGVLEYVFPDYVQRPVGVVYFAHPLSSDYRCDAYATDVRAFQVSDPILEVQGMVIEQHRAFLLTHAEAIHKVSRLAAAP